MIYFVITITDIFPLLLTTQEPSYTSDTRRKLRHEPTLDSRVVCGGAKSTSQAQADLGSARLVYGGL